MAFIPLICRSRPRDRSYRMSADCEIYRYCCVVWKTIM